MVGLGEITTFRLNMYTSRLTWNTNARWWVAKALTHHQRTTLCGQFMYRTCGSHPTLHVTVLRTALLYKKQLQLYTSNDTVYIPAVYMTKL